ncbi:prepilin peptidase [Anaerobacillus alkalilacustris]|uniref:Prepilin peptidase n=1 Tax=Anaerobacillus alkalilacustris TaxID=393763 RepID=A0A1S2LH61_9BACI|nr:prepilin peptidase [Anaerobacillus alkalilacustris]OIJ11057.1 prepilin peptidase [Anaerobacillus alkalilacustris]
MTFVVLLITLAISFITDIKSRKIFNIVTFPSMFIGIIFNTITFGWEGLFFSILGLLTGFGLLVIPYALGGIAAGDVKLLMAIGALQGSSFVFGSFLYITIIGGVIALVLLIMQGELRNTIKRIFTTAQLKTLNGLNKNELHHAFPYGVAIVLGTICYTGVIYF